MYFDPEPKESRKDVYNFEQEYDALKKSILGRDRIIVIKGLRRTGKTTLMKVVYNELKEAKCFIDGRVVEPRQSAVYSALLNAVAGAVTEKYVGVKAREIIEAIRFEFMGISLSLKKERALRFFSDVDKVLERKKETLIVFIDEVQRINPGNIDGIIAHVFEHTKNIKFVLAGSEIGLLDQVIGTDAKSSLYGRPKKIIQIQKLTEEQAKGFLRSGFKQAGIKMEEDEIERVVEVLDGVIGWLTLFGYYAIEEGKKTALKKVIEEGAKITAEEIENFLRGREIARRKYLRIMEGLVAGLRWIEVKRLLEAEEGKKVNDKMVSKYLAELEKYSFIVKTDGRYFLSDPMIQRGVKLLTNGK
ncbi:MAG: ATP-binding protein [Candidatus Anstonellales archaeon]